MFKNVSHKFKIFLASVFLILTFFFSEMMENSIRRLIDFPRIDEKIENPSSRLLSLLLDENSFSSKWEWDLITTLQSSNDSVSNSRAVDYSIRKFTGIYENYKVRVIHTITQYENSSDLPIGEPESNLGTIGVVSILEIYDLEEFNTENTPTCYLGSLENNTYVTRCIIALEHDSIYERIDLDIYAGEHLTILQVYKDFPTILQ